MRDGISTTLDSKTANVIVPGLRYVGLPAACPVAEAGFPVVGICRSQQVVDMINHGICPIEGREGALSRSKVAVCQA